MIAQYLCKCCGAALDVNGKDRVTVCRCGSCSVMQTIPQLDFDEKAILWERAEKLRRAGEYDRAEAIYREILEIDSGDSEIYWCIVLCRYGVEYVEEPGSRKRVPTINRFSYRPIVDDEDYRAAVKLADGDRRRLYILQMQELEELRKKVLAVSQAAQPYDIFICYKENDLNGRRTEDSVLAAELYRALTADGYRVFYARVTLEDKTGREYEPYIFAALNSAKLMFAVGTSPDNFNAPWVKNEWSRYLTRISESGEGTLAVLYKGMRREDLPSEFAHLQCFDMSAPDITEELLRGVHKMFVGSGSGTEQSADVPAQKYEENAESMLRRAEILLEDGEFKGAWELCENALNLEPENAGLYRVRLLAGFHKKRVEELNELAGDIAQSSDYRMIMRFGDDELKSQLMECRKYALYNRFSAQLQDGGTEQICLAAAEGFKSLGDFKNSAELSEKCLEKAKTARLEEQERLYQRAISLLNNNDPSGALPLLETLGDHRDSAALYRRIKAELDEQERLREQEAREAAAAEELRAKKTSKIRKIAVRAAAVAAGVIAVTAAAVVIGNNVRMSQDYAHAVELRDNGEYDEAAAAFLRLGNYSDAEEQIAQTRYQKASALYESGDFDSAELIFRYLGDYLDSEEMFDKVRYDKAVSVLENGEYDKAANMFGELSGYSDSAEKVKYAKYCKAEKLLSEGNSEAAAAVFTALGDYSDSAARVLNIRFEQAKQLADEGSDKQAMETLAALYEEAGDTMPDVKYEYAALLAAESRFDEAIKLYKELGDYKDADELELKTRYDMACYYIDIGDFSSAEAEFIRLGDYADSAERLADMDNIRFRNAGVGDVINFGKFPLSLMGQGYTDEIELSWKVIKRDGTRVLALCNDVIDVRRFGGETWAESSLRYWLNNDFYNSCFTSGEKAMIPTVTVTTPANEETQVSGGADTNDKVFLLSIDEARAHLGDTQFTDWALEKFRLTKEEEYRSWYKQNEPYWWLRSPGHLHDVCYVTRDRTIFTYADPDSLYGVRPAVWIEMGE